MKNVAFVLSLLGILLLLIIITFSEPKSLQISQIKEKVNKYYSLKDVFKFNKSIDDEIVVLNENLVLINNELRECESNESIFYRKVCNLQQTIDSLSEKKLWKTQEKLMQIQKKR